MHICADEIRLILMAVPGLAVLGAWVRARLAAKRRDDGPVPRWLP